MSGLPVEPLARLEAVGVAVHGTDWQSPTARDLDVSPRSLRRWIHGDRAAPEWLRDRLETVLIEAAVDADERSAKLMAFYNELDQD